MMGSFEKRICQVCILLSLVWMAGIFLFSARDAETSTEDSHRLGLWIGQMTIPDFDQWTVEEQIAYAEKIDYPVRKGAHASEYCVLAVLLAGAYLPLWQMQGWKYLFCPWATAVAYAATDELHQFFVPGRSCQLTDVCIDGMGALAGLLFLLMLVHIWRKIRKQIRKR